jgi:hypothetical protein
MFVMGDNSFIYEKLRGGRGVGVPSSRVDLRGLCSRWHAIGRRSRAIWARPGSAGICWGMRVSPMNQVCADGGIFSANRQLKKHGRGSPNALSESRGDLRIHPPPVHDE